MTMGETQEKSLKPRHYRALGALAVGGGLEDAADAAGVSTVTVRRWLRMPEFREELNRVTGDIAHRAGRRLAALCDDAIGALEGVLRDKKSPKYVKARAAKDTLELALRWRESVAFEERLNRLEERLACHDSELD